MGGSEGIAKLLYSLCNTTFSRFLKPSWLVGKHSENFSKCMGNIKKPIPNKLRVLKFLVSYDTELQGRDTKQKDEEHRFAVRREIVLLTSHIIVFKITRQLRLGFTEKFMEECKP